MKAITTSFPLELIHLDFLMMGTRNDGDRNVNELTIMDHFTRYAAAHVTPNQTAPVAVSSMGQFSSELWMARENFDRSRKEL